MSLSDKRKTYRVYIRIPITCALYDAQTKTTKDTVAVIEDISVDGLYFEFDTLMHLNTEIKVSFQLPHSKTDIHAVIKIVRVETGGTNSTFGVGAMFTQISEINKDEIKQFTEHLNINKLLELAVQKGASDLHLLANQVPVLRINGDLTEQVDLPPFFAEELHHLLYSIMTREQIRHFEKEKELDFGIQYDIDNRFRINVHQQRGFIESTFRLISTKSFSFEELNIPKNLDEMDGEKPAAE